MKKYLLIIIFIICVAILIGFLVVGNKNNGNDAEENKVSNVVINNTVNNNANEIDVNEIENTVQNAIENITNSVNSEIENENTIEESETPTISEQTNVNVEDSGLEGKAIDLAKKEWGEDSSVYFTNEGKEGEYYIVAVRDKSTTSVQIYYKIDLVNNTVEIE